MSFAESIHSVLSGYVKFNGRARRSEYWWWVLLVVVISAVVQILLAVSMRPNVQESQLTGRAVALSGVSIALYVLAVVIHLALLLPSLAVAVRRLHDTGRRGWWLFIELIPLVGTIILLVFYLTKGTPGPNAYGQDPKAPHVADIASF